MFKVIPDPKNRLLLITLEGFWDAAVMTAFEAAERVAIAQITQRPGPFDQIIDSRDYPVQAPAIITRHSAWAEQLADMGLRRTAIVMGPSGLARMQANRISTHNHKSFASEAEARIWLQEP
jgi:hypothetical protein